LTTITIKLTTANTSPKNHVIDFLSKQRCKGALHSIGVKTIARIERGINTQANLSHPLNTSFEKKSRKTKIGMRKVNQDFTFNEILKQFDETVRPIWEKNITITVG
jgi:hypothetical protein